MPYKCFLIEETEEVVHEVIVCEDGTCPNFSCHRADAVIGKATIPLGEEYPPVPRFTLDQVPTHCACGFEFSLAKRKYAGTGSGRMWRRVDTGEVQRRISDFPIGAMWRADWYDLKKADAQGRKLYGWDWDNQIDPPLVVKTPGGEWIIDSRASNCTLPVDRLHRCWVRHGEVPNITIDKNGHTCAAGAGSIMCGNYHGFLRNGYLTDGC
jgi:hypothetical protein